MNLKSIIKRTILYRKGYTEWKKKYTQNRIEKWNRKYRAAIDALHDETVFQKRVDYLKRQQNAEGKKYYIIRNSNTKVGIMGYLNVFIPHIAYALYHGYIPIIDMQRYETIYQEANENVWETFFQQPMGYTLSDIQPQDRVIYCPDELWYRWMPSSYPMMSEEDITFWGKLYAEFIHFEEKTADYIEQELSALVSAPQNTVSVIWRGTTYAKGHATGHPVQPSFEELKEKVDEFLKQYCLDKIYLASDEKSVVDFFEAHYPGKIIVNKRFFYDLVDSDFSKYNTDGTDLSAEQFSQTDAKYQIGLTYLSSMNIAANCWYFVGGACGGTTAVLYMNNDRFGDKYVFDLGKYE